MSRSSCVWCGAPASEAHHPAGTLDDVHVAEALTVDYCDDCHHDEHTIRRALGLDRGPSPPTRMERAELVLRRLAVTSGRLGGALFEGLAALFVRLAEWIAADLAALDRRMPGWRAAIA